MHCVSCGASLPEAAEGACSACGSEPRLQGRFLLRSPIGAGAHGTTWNALDTRTGARVAVKELPLRLGAPDKIVALFRREAEVLRQLDHPAIPSLIDAFEAGQGRQRALWIAMDFIDGRTLAQELEEHRYDEAEVLDILEELCGVLTYLHSRQPPVVHRDLKPGNVIRRSDGRLAVVDFGSVRDAMRCADLGGSTVAGTFGYMAPEQFAGDAEPRSDLYALGAIGVHLLTRKVPHSLQRPGQPIAFADHAALRPEVARLLTDLVALDAEDRPVSAQDVAARIRAIRRGASEVQVPTSAAGAGSSVAAPAAAALARAPGPSRATEGVVLSESVPATTGSPSARSPAPVATVGPDPAWAAPSRPPSLFTDELRLTVHGRRPVTPGDEAAILDAIAETVGLDGDGQMTEGGYRWRSRVAGRTVRVAVDTVDDGARIRVIEDHTSATMGYLLGLGGGVTLAAGFAGLWPLWDALGPAAGLVYFAGIAATMGLLSVGLSRTSRRVRDDRSVRLATAIQERLGGATGPPPQLPTLPERPFYTGAAGVAAATLWTMFDFAGAPLGPWWVALIVLAGSLGGLSPGKKTRKQRRDAERRAAKALQAETAEAAEAEEAEEAGTAERGAPEPAGRGAPEPAGASESADADAERRGRGARRDKAKVSSS